ncbi:MAG TPA: tripartite tricarboxylate transporter TctB family protein [Candidatus Binatia bacterium]|nr:tripartite tricarboxylate transporter TctB family protein [Candidatus Binatia bacterium]
MSRKKAELLLSALFVLFLIWTLWESRNWPAPSKLFPWALGLSVLLLAMVQLALAWRAAFRVSPSVSATMEKGRGENELAREHKRGGEHAPAELIATWSVDAAPRRILAICGWIVAFFLGIWLVGFKLGSLLLTFAFLKFTAIESLLISAAIAVGTALFFWLVFDMALKIPLDNGILGYYFSLN